MNQVHLMFHISFFSLVPLSLQNAIKALYKSVTKIGSIGNVWGFLPKCPYFMMRFREHPLFPNCFQGQTYFCVDMGGPVQGSNLCLWDEYRVLLDSGQLAVEITNRCLATVAPAQTHTPQLLCSQFESVPFI